MSVGSWLLLSIFFVVIGVAARNRLGRGAIMLVSGAAMGLGILATIALIVFAASRHDRNDGSDIFFVVAIFPALGAFFAWIVYILAKKAGDAPTDAEVIIPHLPPDQQRDRPGA